jgi:hypothetical protein
MGKVPFKFLCMQWCDFNGRKTILKNSAERSEEEEPKNGGHRGPEKDLRHTKEIVT